MDALFYEPINGLQEPIHVTDEGRYINTDICICQCVYLAALLYNHRHRTTDGRYKSCPRGYVVRSRVCNIDGPSRKLLLGEDKILLFIQKRGDTYVYTHTRARANTHTHTILWLAAIFKFKMAVFTKLANSINAGLTGFLDPKHMGLDTTIQYICASHTEIWAKYDLISDHFEIQDNHHNQVSQYYE
jgi:hypothetical protein